MKSIRNYTSSVPAMRSVNFIEELLVEIGALEVLKEYDDNKKLSGISFTIPMPNGKKMPVKLPAKVHQIEVALQDIMPTKKESQLQKLKQQSERTAWKLLLDWVSIQATMIKLQQVEFMEVFLPYYYDAREEKTFFELVKGSGYKQLTNQ